MQKNKSLTKIKKKYWDLFSYYIKLKYSDDGVNVKCFTCNNVLKIGTSNCQGGHYYTKKGYPALYFDENNVRCQCYHCNINLSGNTVIYGERLLEEIGVDAMEDLKNRRHDSVKKMYHEYEEMIKDIKVKIKELENSF